jgi:DNA polymerase III subunit delta'
MASIPDLIIGHDKQCGQLLQDIAKDNVSHAYLFSGPAHIGKFSVARWFAWRLLCDKRPPEEAKTIGGQIERMIHPDYLSLDKLWIEEVQEDWGDITKTSNIPQQHRSKAPKARTDVIGIEEVRLMQDRLHETGQSDYLCCLIRSVERMQPAAANAFLKVLEEPPKRVIFILTTESEATLLPTLISRTRVMKFHPVASENMRTLTDALPTDDASIILHLAQGAPGKAIRLRDDPEVLRREKQLHSQAKQFWQSKSLTQRFQWISSFIESKAETDDLLLHLGVALREYADITHRAEWTKAYMTLVNGLRTNAHRGLVLQEFALALGD